MSQNANAVDSNSHVLFSTNIEASDKTSATELIDEDDDEDNIPLKELKLRNSAAEEVAFAYFEKQPTTMPSTSAENVAEGLSSTDGVNAQKAEVVKRAKESKEVKEFRKLFTESDNFKGWRLQEGPCADEYYSACFQCSSNKNDKDKNDCRFYNRMLRSVKNPKECRRLTIADARFFVDETKASTSTMLRRKDFWKTSGTPGRKRITRSSKVLNLAKPTCKDAHIAAYTLQCAKKQFQEIVSREEAMLKLDCLADGVFFSHSLYSNQICDVCNCLILNTHYCCIICGIELCWLCYGELTRSISGDFFPNWLKKLSCLNGVEHIASMFHVGAFLPYLELHKNLLRKVEEQFDRYGIHSGGPACNGNHGRRRFQEEKCYCPRRCTDVEVLETSVCRIKDQFDTEAVPRFKVHLSLHVPVIVEGVDEHHNFYSAVWSREALEKVVLGQKKVRVFDCQTSRQAYVDGKICTVAQFWKRFDSKHNDGEPFLKIQHFPENSTFKEVAPEQYENFFDILPFSDYTNVDSTEAGPGKLNLLNFLPEEDNSINFGIKASIGLGLCEAPLLASMPLRVAVSDTVNYLALSQPPKEFSRGGLSKIIAKRLTLEGISEEDQKKLLKRPDKVGAIWKVFHPNETSRLREFIVAWKQKNGEKADGDVIYTQNVVVTVPLLSFLKKQGLHCYVFVQCEGEVVFIPSGSAYQVQNLNSCIMISEVFATVESIDQVVKVSNDLRRLKLGNDCIPVDTMLYSACSKSAEILSGYSPCLTSSCL